MGSSNGQLAVFESMKGSGFLPLLVAAVTPLLILALIVSATGFGLVAWKPPVLWSTTFGASPGVNSATVVASDSSGEYVGGYTNSSRVGGTPGSVFLTKYDPTGGIVWSHVVGNTNDSFIDGISVGPDGLYLSGENIGGLTIFKYQLTGIKGWTIEFAPAGSCPCGIFATSTGLYFAGSSTVPVTNQSYAGAVSFVRKYDLSGNPVWTNEFYNDTASIRGVYAFSSGVYVGGTAQTPLPGQTQAGGFLVKYDLAGNEVWTRQLSSIGSGIAGDSTGVYVSGSSLRKYSFDGSLDWASTISSPDFSVIHDSWLSVDSSGVYLSLSTGAGREFLVKYDLNGNQIWTLQMQQPLRDDALGYAYRLSPGSSGVYVAGSTVDTSGSLPSLALVALVAPSASLVFFGVNPPLSFVILGGLIGGAVASLFFFRKLRRGRVRPPRVGPTPHSLPITD